MIGEERVHPATPRRREDARRRGVVARSADLTRSAGLLAAVIGIGFLLEPITKSVSGLMRNSFASVGALGSEQALDLLRTSMGSVALWLAPLLLVILLVTVAVHALQTGFTWRAIPFKVGEATPAGRRMAVTAKSLLKFVLLVLVAAWTIRHQASTTHLGASIATLMIRLSLTFLLIGLADYALERRRIESELRMTPQELREESRQTDGNPRLRKERRTRARQWMARD